jgi:nucleotide-binding universal stress UspA family protein
VQAVPPQDEVVAAAAPGVPLVVQVADVDALRTQAQQYLDGIATKLTERLGQPVAAEVCLGDPTQVIADATHRQQADLVVMGTHGRTGLSRTVFGSVAGSVLRQAAAPLLLVRPTDLIEPTLLPASADTARA